MKKEMTASKNKAPKNRKLPKAIVSKEVKDYGNDPFFIKKANASQNFLEKNGFPSLPKK